MVVRYVGIVKRGASFTLALGQSERGSYYVWSGAKDLGLSAGDKADVPIHALSLATEQQIAVGRSSPCGLDVRHFEAEYQGVVSRGKKNSRVLVKADGQWFTGVVAAESLEGVAVGGTISLDRRTLSPARADQVDAGLGLGTLQRKSGTVN